LRIVGVQHGDAAGRQRAQHCACSAATSATVFMNSWCSRCALLMTATVGWAIAASSAVSPGMVHAELDDGGSVLCAQSEQRERQPIALFRLPVVASTLRAP
jgi:hypothetical protein